MESAPSCSCDPADKLVRIWKTPAPDVIKELRWNAHKPLQEKYTCSIEVFGCIWIYDEQGLHFIEKDNAVTQQILKAAEQFDSTTARQTDVSLEEWLTHWNFWKTDYKRGFGENVIAFRKEEYDSRAWSSVCFVEQACIKLCVPIPPWPAKCNLTLYTNRHKFNIITKDKAFPVKVWKTSSIHILGIPMHTILNYLNFLDAVISPPGAYHGYIEVYDKIWEYGPQGLTCVLPECSSDRKNAILMYTGYTTLTYDDWMKEWQHFNSATSFRSTANAYSLFNVNCLTFLTYALNALGVERTKEIQGLTRWMRQFVWHGKQLRVPGIGADIFIPPLSWIVKIIWPCCIAIVSIPSYYAIKWYWK